MDWIEDTEKVIPDPGFEEPWIQIPSTGYGLILVTMAFLKVTDRYGLMTYSTELDIFFLRKTIFS
jgi:hypothetical protein